VNRRRFLGLAAALGAAGAAAAACGVPGESNPERVGGPPSTGPLGTGSSGVPPAPDSASTANELVEKYFMATAGANYGGADKPNALNQGQALARSYLSDAVKDQWQPNHDLIVVRVAIDPARPDGKGRNLVDAHVQPLGTLNGFGSIEALEPNQTTASTITFTVAQVGAQYRLAELPPPDLMLSDAGLAELYQPQTIYFWDGSDTNPLLVPDQRYMPLAVNESKRPGEILRWLQTGPAALLSGVVESFAEVEVKDTSGGPDDQLTVNLSSKAANLDRTALVQLAVQLRWSVNPDAGVELRIEGAATGVSTDSYRNANASVRPDDGEPERFAIVEHKARPTDTGAVPQILDSDQNVDVVAAAIPRAQRDVALVRTEGTKNPKTQRLWLGTLSGVSENKPPVYVPTGLAGQHITRPVWITRPTSQALVAIDGTLYAADALAAGATTATTTPITSLPRGLPRTVTALAVSPDGHRIALVAGGQVVVAGLQFTPQLGLADTFTVVDTDIATPVTVAWSAENKLLVGGSLLPGSRTGIVEVGIDGTGQTPVPDNGEGDNAVVDMLCVRPASPIGSPSQFVAMFDAGDIAYRVYTATVLRLALSAGAGASPPAGSAAPVISAPFFLD
jgi:hypothetical protein